VPLDLKDGPAFPRLAGAIAERWKKLDILIGNAGVFGALTPVTNINPKDWVEALEVNLNANLRLIQFLDPLLKASEAGRAVFVTSGAAQNTRAYWGTYSASKAALDALIKTYAAECASTSVRANLFNPGPTRTAMRAKGHPGEDPMTLPAPEDVAPHIVALALPSETRNGEIVSFKR
jgi:NAD(P)-dependent dehydrogenase (short-subunit alcohol dehydrogenase family)